MPRLFTALSIPRDIRQKAHLLAGGIPGAHWHVPENYHITLTFLGEVEEADIDDVDEALAGIDHPQPEIKIRGAGIFERGNTPTALWLGVEHSEVLDGLKQKIDRALEMLRIPYESRKYVPHMTLAHLHHVERAKVAEFIVANNLFKAQPFFAPSFHLYVSHDTKNGRHYEAIESYPLGDEGGDF